MFYFLGGTKIQFDTVLHPLAMLKLNICNWKTWAGYCMCYRWEDRIWVKWVFPMDSGFLGSLLIISETIRVIQQHPICQDCWETLASMITMQQLITSGSVLLVPHQEDGLHDCIHSWVHGCFAQGCMALGIRGGPTLILHHEPWLSFALLWLWSHFTRCNYSAQL